MQNGQADFQSATPPGTVSSSLVPPQTLSTLSGQAASPPRPSAASTEPPSVIVDILAHADVRLNGDRPWDIRVVNPRLYHRILTSWSLGFGEAFMDGDWECDDLDGLFTRLLTTNIESAAVGRARARLLFEHMRHRVMNLQSRNRAFQVGEQHYDVGNDIFEAMLDSRMIYSCAYWANATTLEEAQYAKLDLICRKLELKPGERLLDIGCGWGGLARFAAEHYGAHVTGVTISKEQLALAQERCAGLPVDLRLQDYRELDGQFDKIVSVGMFEHVGPKNYPVYFDTAQRLLAPEGLFLLHTIGIDVRSAGTDPWIDKYVFPNGKLPAATEIADVVENRFLIEDWHNFGRDYDRTLMVWWDNFVRAWPQLQHKYGERFYRMWKYYLLVCAAFFRSRQGQLWQVVLTHRDRQAPYRSVR